MYIGVHVN